MLTENSVSLTGTDLSLNEFDFPALYNQSSLLDSSNDFSNRFKEEKRRKSESITTSRFKGGPI